MRAWVTCTVPIVPDLDPFLVLGLPRDATPEQVEAAYLRRAALAAEARAAATSDEDRARIEHQHLMLAHAHELATAQASDPVLFSGPSKPGKSPFMDMQLVPKCGTAAPAQPGAAASDSAVKRTPTSTGWQFGGPLWTFSRVICEGAGIRQILWIS